MPADKNTGGLADKHGAFLLQFVSDQGQQFPAPLLQDQGGIARVGADVVVDDLGIIHDQIIVLILALHPGEMSEQLGLCVLQMKSSGQAIKTQH